LPSVFGAEKVSEPTGLTSCSKKWGHSDAVHNVGMAENINQIVNDLAFYLNNRLDELEDGIAAPDLDQKTEDQLIGQAIAFQEILDKIEDDYR
jgi:hypothetical protein